MSSIQRDNATETQELFNALAEPTRRGIIELLATKGQLSATDICDNFDVSRPAISQHLKLLRNLASKSSSSQGNLTHRASLSSKHTQTPSSTLSGLDHEDSQ